MNSFILFFKKSPGFLYAFILILGIECFLHFFPKTDYIDPTGIFYTNLKRKIAESENNFDFIMLGDSRSLSIYGKKGDGSEPSFYNFSLPAAGIRYLPYFVDKYLKNNKKPFAILFALDPEQFHPNQTKAFHIDPKIWQLFKHRLLNLFTLFENLKQYEGKEAYFIFKESFPMLLPSYRHREGLEKLLTGMKGSDLIEGNFPYYKSNLRLENLTLSTNGQVNLGTYLELPPGITFDWIQMNVNRAVEKLNHSVPDLNGLDLFLEYAKEKNLTILLIEVPHAEGYATTQFYQMVREGYREREKKYDFVYFFEFPNHSYPLDHFAEGIHFNDKGEKRVNQEFYTYIWPQILKFYKP